MPKDQALRSNWFLRFLQILSVAWRHGGPWERFFVLFIWADLVVVLLTSGLVVWAVYTHRWPIEVGWTFTLPLISSGVFLTQPLTVALYSDRVLREALRRGWMGPNRADEEFYEELARYKEAHGKQGHLPWDVAWGVLAWAVLYAKLGAAIAYGFALYQVLGFWTQISFAGIDFPIDVAFVAIYGRRATKRLREAEARGFPLMRLYSRRSDVTPAKSSDR